MTAKKILFVNLYGIGNCILSTPTISALKSLGFVVTVLVTRSRCSDVAFKDWAEVNIIYYNDVPVVLDRAFSFVLWKMGAQIVMKQKVPGVLVPNIGPNIRM